MKEETKYKCRVSIGHTSDGERVFDFSDGEIWLTRNEFYEMLELLKNKKQS